ncbi:hypothetical protein [Halomonas sp. PR-M31]|uniref:hypothetical protein n=1 Tax=Halomonas sp. PR-M31 TaxID=1471202 RepID=UPI000A673FE2
MRRTLADSTFVRVYATLLLALVLTFGLAMMGYMIVDQVRREYYRERLADTPMALLTILLSEVQPAERKQWLQRQGEHLDMQLSLYRKDEQAFSYFQRRRSRMGARWSCTTIQAIPGVYGGMCPESLCCSKWPWRSCRASSCAVWSAPYETGSKTWRHPNIRCNS